MYLDCVVGGQKTPIFGVSRSLRVTRMPKTDSAAKIVKNYYFWTFRAFGLILKWAGSRPTCACTGTNKIMGRDAWHNVVGQAMVRGTGRQSRRVHPAVDPARPCGVPRLDDARGRGRPDVVHAACTRRRSRLDTWRHSSILGAADQPPSVHFGGPNDSSA